MSDTHATKKYPQATSEIAEILGLNKEISADSHVPAAAHPHDLPIESGHGSDSKEHGVHGSEHGTEHANQPSPILAVAKSSAPYFAVFIVGLALYYFFFTSVNLAGFFNSILPKASVEKPRETAIEELYKDNAENYNAWIAQYYFDVSDSSIIDPKTDNSGNGLTNFHKFLLKTNPKAYDTLGLGMADSEAVARGISPTTGGKLTDSQKQIVEQFFDMEAIMNRLSLRHAQSGVSGLNVLSGNSGNGIQQTTFNFPGGSLATSTQSATNSNQNNFISAGIDINTEIPGRLEIPSLNINVPIIFSKDPKNFEADLQSGVVHYPGTALPGEVGTSYISGHSSNYAWAKGSYNQVFSKLDKLANNASFKITVVQKNGKDARLFFVVIGKKEYKPTDQEQFMNAGKPTVALSTCWPLGSTAKRLVVTGELTQVER